MSNYPANQLDEKRMSAFQWWVIALCFVINMLDGFDVLVMAFTASSVAADWGLSGLRLGYLLSAGLVGMAIGSLFIAPWADRFGRRPLILVCIAVAGAGMLASSQATGPGMLAAFRFVTGLGIGGILASSYVIAGEYANKRWRGLAISLQSTAYALGATIGGVIAAKMIPALGWRSVFLYGGFVTLAILPVLFLWLPESLAFLMSRKSDVAIKRINQLRLRVKLAPLDEMPESTHATRTSLRASFAQLFSPALLRSTLLIWVSFFLVMFGFYFVMSWTPRLLVTAGLSNEQGITGGVLLNVGGIFGTALVGLLAARFRLSKVLMIYLLTNALLLGVFVKFTDALHLAFVLAVLIGIFVNGCVAGLYALTPSIYDASQRVTGLGWGIGIGRAGAIASPLVAGQLIDAHWNPSDLYLLFAMAFVLASIAVALLGRSSLKPLHTATSL
ncbi:MFS transporter [Pseudomonas sp. 39004]|jgi:benzoate transport|uniref:MFS transporter n=1 Tax=Pseudomonas sp. 39004 TaxID=2967213 RepID=UPI002363FA1F|nr:MFS transporter [Pseudomonas sp. 39004]MDD1962960.1 MFS transporter [Pseudomonas sp. 39004]